MPVNCRVLAASLCLFLVFLCLSTCTAAASEELNVGALRGTSWWSQVQTDIAGQEYEITWQDSAPGGGAFHAANRAQNLRCYFRDSGVEIVPRAGDAGWCWGFELTGIGQGDSWQAFDRMEPTAIGRLVEYVRPSVTEWYENRDNGVEQGFVIEEVPRGDFQLGVNLKGCVGQAVRWDAQEGGDKTENICAGTCRVRDTCWGADLTGSVQPAAGLVGDGCDGECSGGGGNGCDGDGDGADARLVLEGRIYGDLDARLGDGGDHVSFLRDGAEVLRYGALKVIDAGGVELASRLVLDGDLLVVVIEEQGIYPIFVDPLLTSPSWVVEGDRSGASLGDCVSSAGDVNGDGYSDVVVGAPWHLNGDGTWGRVYAYYGGASGLSTTADWMILGGEDQGFGNSASCAGDVNDDGYSDVIVGNHGAGVGGRALVYHGGPTGLSATPDWIAESDVPGGIFGYSVSGAGDVNNDGYSDVIVGDQFYTNGLLHEGAAYVYHGGPSGLSTTADWFVETNRDSSRFGFSVSSAGDVNDDGYGDVIIGAIYDSNGETYEGTAFVYCGSDTGLSEAAAWMGESNQVGARYGRSVTCAGDVNGDGYDDVAVSSIYYHNPDNDEGRAYVYHGSASGPSTTPDWIAEGNQAEAFFGISVASAGDVNQDGYSDVIVGSSRFDNGEEDEGRAYVYYGGGSGLSAAADWIAEPDRVDTHFGSSVASAGDVNGDGYVDVIIGADEYDNGQTNEGAAYVYHSTYYGLSHTADWSDEGDQADASFGFSVSDAGDVNDDGYSDVIVGAFNYDNGEENEGRAYVYHGSDSGLSVTPSWIAESDSSNSYFGRSVSGAGDVNGDGYSDVIIGAPEYDGDQPLDGRVFIYHGSAVGLSATPDWWVEGDQDSIAFGYEVSDAGDVNGDNYGDVIIGAYKYDNGQSNEGRAYVYYGSASGLSDSTVWTGEIDQVGALYGISVSGAGDVNGDGYSDVIVGAYTYDNGETGEGAAFVYHGSASGLSDTLRWFGEGGQEYARYGRSVSGAGDVNDDGYDDVIVGAPWYGNGEVDEGRAYVYHGSAFGLSWVAAQTMESDQENAHFGISVSGAGDVNGDGYSDVVVGSSEFDNGENNEGRAFVYHGSGSGVYGSPAWTGEIDNVGARFGRSVSCAGDVNGDGCGDVIVGAYGYSNGATEVGGAFVYHGICDLADVPADPGRGYVDALHQNYPNPFRGVTGTTIQYTVANAGRVVVRIFDAAGRLVKSITAHARPGENYVRWDGRAEDGHVLPSGVYFYEIRARGFAAHKKMILAR